MNKKELTGIIVVAGLSLLFLTASIALYLTKGRSQYWTAKKMKLGALLLTISAATSLSSCGPDTTTCYETVLMKDMITLQTDKNTVNLKSTNEIKGTINYRSSEIYSFNLTKDTIDTVYQKGLLIPEDGKFNDSTEFFTIKLDTGLIPGNYILKIYDQPLNKQTSSIAYYDLIINKDE
jgi:hypothetical protein